MGLKVSPHHDTYTVARPTYRHCSYNNYTLYTVANMPINHYRRSFVLFSKLIQHIKKFILFYLFILLIINV